MKTIITDETINKIARLSELSIEESEKDDIREAFSEMLDFVDALKNVDTDGVEPMIRVHDTVNVWRRDFVNEYDNMDGITACSPSANKDISSIYEVPRTVDEA